MNFFKYIELIEAKSAKLLALKLRSINMTYQLNSVWSDGVNHYALINGNKKLSVSQKEKLANIKE